MGCSQKVLNSCGGASPPVRIPSQWSLAPNVTSVTSANDKSDNEMIPGAWHLPYNCKKHRKTSARIPSMKTMQPVIASNAVPYLQMRLVGSHKMSRRERMKLRVGNGDQKEVPMQRTILTMSECVRNDHYRRMRRRRKRRRF
jgi:hypothetical protein